MVPHLSSDLMFAATVTSISTREERGLAVRSGCRTEWSLIGNQKLEGSREGTVQPQELVAQFRP